MSGEGTAGGRRKELKGKDQRGGGGGEQKERSVRESVGSGGTSASESVGGGRKRTPTVVQKLNLKKA